MIIYDYVWISLLKMYDEFPRRSESIIRPSLLACRLELNCSIRFTRNSGRLLRDRYSCSAALREGARLSMQPYCHHTCTRTDLHFRSLNNNNNNNNNSKIIFEICKINCITLTDNINVFFFNFYAIKRLILGTLYLSYIH